MSTKESPIKYCSAFEFIEETWRLCVAEKAFLHLSLLNLWDYFRLNMRDKEFTGTILISASIPASNI